MVEYFGIEAAPGQQFFRCERLRANLGTNSCANNWRQANHEGVESRLACKRCVVGAEHAGELHANLSALHGTLTCERCHRGAERLIGGQHCVSCYNRQREALLGRNAKGTRPTKLPPLEPRRIWFLAGQALTCLAKPRTTDLSELIVAALRDSQERVRFAFKAPPPRRAQLAFPW